MLSDSRKKRRAPYNGFDYDNNPSFLPNKFAKQNEKMTYQDDDISRDSLQFGYFPPREKQSLSRNSMYQEHTSFAELEPTRQNGKRKKQAIERRKSSLDPRPSKRQDRANTKNNSHSFNQHKSHPKSGNSNAKLGLLDKVVIILEQNKQLLAEFNNTDLKYADSMYSVWSSQPTINLFRELYQLHPFKAKLAYQNPINVVFMILRDLADKKNGIRVFPAAQIFLEFLPYLLFAVATSTVSTIDTEKRQLIIHRLGKLVDNNPGNPLLKKLWQSNITQTAVLQLLQQLQTISELSVIVIGTSVAGLGMIAKAELVPIELCQLFIDPLYELTKMLLANSNSQQLSEKMDAQSLESTILALGHFAKAGLIRDKYQEVFSEQLKKLTETLLYKVTASLSPNCDPKHVPSNLHITVTALTLGYFAKAGLIKDEYREVFNEQLKRLTQALLKKITASLSDCDSEQAPTAINIINVITALGYFAYAGLITNKREVFNKQLKQLTQVLLDRILGSCFLKHLPDALGIGITASALGYFVQAGLISDKYKKVFSEQLIELTQALLNKIKAAASQYCDPKHVPDVGDIVHTISALSRFAIAGLIIDFKKKRNFNTQLIELIQVLLDKSKTFSSPSGNPKHRPDARHIANAIIAVGYFAKSGVIIDAQRMRFSTQLIELTKNLQEKINATVSKKFDPDHAFNAAKLIGTNVFALGYFIRAGFIPPDKQQAFTTELIKLTKALPGNLPSAIFDGGKVLDKPYTVIVTNIFWTCAQFVKVGCLEGKQTELVKSLKKLLLLLAFPHFMLSKKYMLLEAIIMLSCRNSHFRNLFAQSTHLHEILKNSAENDLHKERMARCLFQLGQQRLLPKDYFSLPLPFAPLPTKKKVETSLTTVVIESKSMSLDSKRLSPPSTTSTLSSATSLNSKSVRSTENSDKLNKIGIAVNLLGKLFGSFASTPSPPTTSTPLLPATSCSLKESKSHEIEEDVTSTLPMVNSEQSPSAEPTPTPAPIIVLPDSLTVSEDQVEKIVVEKIIEEKSSSSTETVTDVAPLLSPAPAVPVILIPPTSVSQFAGINQETKEKLFRDKIISPKIRAHHKPPYTRKEWEEFIYFIRGKGDCETNCSALTMALLRFAQTGVSGILPDSEIEDDGYNPLEWDFKSIVVPAEEKNLEKSGKRVTRSHAPSLEKIGRLNTQFELKLMQGIVRFAGTIVDYRKFAEQLRLRATKQGGYIIGLVQFSRCTKSEKRRYQTRSFTEERHEKIDSGHVMAFQYNTNLQPGEKSLLLFEPESLIKGTVDGTLIYDALPEWWFDDNESDDPFYPDVSYVIIDSPALRQGIDPGVAFCENEMETSPSHSKKRQLKNKPHEPAAIELKQSVLSAPAYLSNQELDVKQLDVSDSKRTSKENSGNGQKALKNDQNSHKDETSLAENSSNVIKNIPLGSIISKELHPLDLVLNTGSFVTKQSALTAVSLKRTSTPNLFGKQERGIVGTTAKSQEPTDDKNLPAKVSQHENRIVLQNSSIPITAQSDRGRVVNDSKLLISEKVDGADTSILSTEKQDTKPATFLSYDQRLEPTQLLTQPELKADLIAQQTDQDVKSTPMQLETQEFSLPKHKYAMCISFLLAVLLPRFNDRKQFDIMCQRLFVDCKVTIAEDKILNMNDKKTITYIRNVLRKKLLRQTNATEDACLILMAKALTKHADRIKDSDYNTSPSIVGAISKLARVNITVKKGHTPKRFENPDNTENLVLIEHRGNHYGFMLKTKVYAALTQDKQNSLPSKVISPRQNNSNDISVAKFLGASMTSVLTDKIVLDQKQIKKDHMQFRIRQKSEQVRSAEMSINIMTK